MEALSFWLEVSEWTAQQNKIRNFAAGATFHNSQESARARANSRAHTLTRHLIKTPDALTYSTETGTRSLSEQCHSAGYLGR